MRKAYFKQAINHIFKPIEATILLNLFPLNKFVIILNYIQHAVYNNFINFSRKNQWILLKKIKQSQSKISTNILACKKYYVVNAFPASNKKQY